MSLVTNKVFKKFKRGTTKQREQMISILEKQVTDLKELLLDMRSYR